MRKNFLNNAFLSVSLAVLLSFLLPSCKTGQKTVATPGTVNLPAEQADSLFAKVQQHEFQFEWLTAKASVEYTDANNQQTSFTVNLRAANDSLLWLSVTPLLGIEVVRVLITRDSIYLLDRLHNTYIVRDYRFLEDMLKTPVRFDMLQAILTGNYFSGIEGGKIISVYEESPYYILSTLPKLKTLRATEEKDPNHPQVQDYWIDTSSRMVKTRIEDDNLKRTLTIDYPEYTAHGDTFFPKIIRLNIEASKPSRITIEYNKYNTDGPLSFPFSVPEKYSRE